MPRVSEQIMAMQMNELSQRMTSYQSEMAACGRETSREVTDRSHKHRLALATHAEVQRLRQRAEKLSAMRDAPLLRRGMSRASDEVARGDRPHSRGRRSAKKLI